MDIVIEKGVSGSTLKIIAMVAMLIDHIGAVVLARAIHATGDRTIYDVYMVLRNIGRIAFPIFCFLLVEGFVHTSDKIKYALRLGGFAIFSEIPFDLALTSKTIQWEHLNVFFTLLLGLLALMGYYFVEQKVQDNVWLCMGFQVAIVGVYMAVAELLRTDYGAIGVLTIVLLYVFRGNRVWQILGGFPLILQNGLTIYGFVMCGLYNGKRGIKMKYVFYLFYPVHLLILFGICYAMGISGYAAV